MFTGKLAIPSNAEGGLDGQRSNHFGHCDVFTIVDIEQGEIRKVTTVPTPEHHEGGCLVPVSLLAGLKVNALIAGGMGMRPLMGFQEAGISVYFDRQHPEIGNVVKEFLSGNLEMMTTNNACGGGGH